MRTVGRLSLIALIVLFVAVALAAGERATALVNAPPSVALTPNAPRETSISTRTLLASPWQDPNKSVAEPEKAERDKTLAWLLLLLKEHRSAR
jgi:hypothetical protein